ncbi:MULTISPECIES: class I adenylate-forming enzyme family protein [Sciscionella]|uniref:class I adenylate-forming enzyme family protein n=1 Tax=Sciscionella TaxID=596495 RepID=UPI000365D635|nr:MULTISPECIES: AMP-binding protein [Sciscionella]
MTVRKSEHVLLHESLWEKEESSPLVEHTVGSLLAARARDCPDSPALVGTVCGTTRQRRLTYRELHAQASRVARALLRIARPGEFVALWAPNVLEWPIVQYGAALAGMRLVALNPVLRASELIYALNHSESSVLIHADRSRDYDLAAVVSAVRGECPNLRGVVSLSEWDSWLDTGRDSTELIACDPDDPVMLQYTSGTTGRPKGVLLRHRALVNVAKLTLETAGAAPGLRAVNPLPMFHTAACVIGTLGPLWLGGCVLLIERFEPGMVLDALRDEDAELLFFVPAILGAIIEKARESGGSASSLRIVMGGGADVPRPMIEEAEKFFGVEVYNLFGQTELAPVLSMTRCGDSHHDLVGTVGRPLPQIECKIVDPETGRTQPLGTPGEICARGYQQLIEYLHDPEATADAVDTDGWVHTGDLGSMDERGMITLTGRAKDLIIRGGENIAPREIESCLAEHEAVAEAAVIGVPDELWGETVGAVIRPRGESRKGMRGELEAYCRDRLSPFKVPEHWLVAEKLPVTPTGKIRKFELVEAAAKGRLTRLM